MTDEEWEDSPDYNTDDGGSIWQFVGLLAAALGLLALLFLMLGFSFGYFEYLLQEGTQQVCEQKYGDGAEYVGDTGFASETGICDTPDGQEYVRLESERMGFDTLQEYLGEVI